MELTWLTARLFRADTHVVIDLVADTVAIGAIAYLVTRLRQAEAALRAANRRLMTLAIREAQEISPPIELLRNLRQVELEEALESIAMHVDTSPCYGVELHGARCPTPDGRYCEFCRLREHITAVRTDQSPPPAAQRQ